MGTDHQHLWSRQGHLSCPGPPGRRMEEVSPEKEGHVTWVFILPHPSPALRAQEGPFWEEPLPVSTLRGNSPDTELAPPFLGSPKFCSQSLQPINTRSYFFLLSVLLTVEHSGKDKKTPREKDNALPDNPAPELLLLLRYLWTMC